MNVTNAEAKHQHISLNSNTSKLDFESAISSFKPNHMSEVLSNRIQTLMRWDYPNFDLCNC